MSDTADVWYESKIFLVIVGYLFGITTSLVGTWFQKRLENRAVAESLKVAFRGEINAVRSGLALDAKTAMKAWERNATLKDFKVSYPRAIYEAHTRDLGALRESILVGHISQLYSTLERVQEVGRRLQTTTYGAEGFSEYVYLLLLCMNMAVVLDMRLTEQTKHLVELDWEVTVSEQDAADRNFAVESMAKIQEAREAKK